MFAACCRGWCLSQWPPVLADVNRVLECCQSCGVGGLVLTSSSDVVAGGGDSELADENQPFVTEQEDETAYAVAMAEAQVLKAR